MKNLKLLANRIVELESNDIQKLCISNERSDFIFYATGNELFSFDWSSLSTNELAPLSDVVTFEHLSLNNELCLATATGDVFTLNLHNQTTETITFCENGIVAMAWSHDQEVVAFVTGTKQLVVMNSAYDPMNECQLDDDEFGEGQFINVGWGKKETQFHGTEGKEAARRKAEEIQIDVSHLDQSVSIEWRGDDEFFVVSFVGQRGRMFKVFDKEGRLKFTSEKIAGLEAAIAWRPSGSWIAVPHVLPNKYTIALFEKNGLRHREIVLPFSNVDETVVNLEWSSDSEVLAIHTSVDNKSNIYLYTICNYHWYLKQTLNHENPVFVMKWDQSHTEGKTLHVLQSTGWYSVYRWDHIVNRSFDLSATDQSLVAVIDGSSLLLTNFRGAVIPPPMCAHTLTHTKNINFVGFIKNGNPNEFFFIDASNVLHFVETKYRIDTERNINLLNDATITESYKYPQKTDVPLTDFHWIVINEKRLIVCATSGNLTHAYLCQFNDETKEIQQLHLHEVEGQIANALFDANGNFIYQFPSGELFSIRFADDVIAETEFDEIGNLNCLCEQIESILVGQEIKIVALKYQQSLFVNEQKIAENVTSFCITSSGDKRFVLFTTLDQLKFVDLSTDHVIGERRIERGAKLVCNVSNDSKTILQMPRGNLEAIQPRLLSLCIISDLLDDGHYRRAFDLLRKQRINLNLLVDHGPSRFLEKIAHFVDEIDNINWMNLFLSDLQNEDVTRTMYSSAYEQKKRDDSSEFTSNKIEIVCSRICNEFERRSTTKYALPIVTTYVKRNNIEKALEIVWNVRKSELSGSTFVDVTAQDALKYLLYLVDVNDLYDVALGMYDFDLVLFVAQKSQKDPKEYVPFLNELKEHETNYRKYRIDCHLKRWSQALPHIVKCGMEKLQECKELIDAHGLHANALRLLSKNDECYEEIVLLYADHLREKRHFGDACLMYERAGDWKQAILQAKNALDWRKCLTLAKKLNYDETELLQLSKSLVPPLREVGKFADAAEVVEHCTNDEQLVVELLCDGKLYQDAIFKSNKNELVRDHLTNYTHQMIEKIRADTEQYNAHTQRLLKVRQNRAARLAGDDDVADVDDCDMFSDTTSMNSSRFSGSSRGSRKSHRSSKNRRKHERKLMSLKQGNPFEDIALVDALYNFALRLYANQQHVNDILRALLDFELDTPLAVNLQEIYDKQLSDVQVSLDKIWIPEMMVSGEIKVEEFLDFVKVQNEQHYAMIKPHQRVKPILTSIEWKIEILK